jgi:hypothetical protein
VGDAKRRARKAATRAIRGRGREKENEQEKQREMTGI